MASIRRIFLAFLALAAAHSSKSWAFTSASSFAVSLTITGSCSVSASNLSFGTTGLVISDIYATSTITVQCTNGTPYQVNLDQGVGYAVHGAWIGYHYMANGTNTITYNLFQDPSHSVYWGNTPGTDSLNGTGSGAAQTLTVYGWVYQLQQPPPGSYTDTVTVTVTY